MDFSALRGDDLQSAVQGILNDPAFGKILAEVSGHTVTTKETPDSPPQKSMPQITPEMMARLPQMMSTLAPLVSGMQGDKKDSNEKHTAGEAEKRKKLLAALRPYLSSSRRDAIDSIMKVTEMTDLLSQFGGIKPGSSEDPPK